MFEGMIKEYLVWHRGSNLTLTRTKSITCATSICEGILNTDILLLNPDTQNLDEKLLNEKTLKVLFTKNIELKALSPFDEASISEKDRYLIKLASDRAHWLLRLEIILEKYRTKNCMGFDTNFYRWFGDALNNSNVQNQTYDPTIREYADINDISFESAYHEIKMKYDSYMMINVKAWAYYEKFKRLINETDSYETMHELIDRCVGETIHAASI